jgi:hypothetical protein
MRFKFTKVATIVAAVCMLGAVGVSSASAALPELVNKNGTELAYGFFSAPTGPNVDLEGATSMERIECTASKYVGVVTGTKTSKVSVSYIGCKAPDKGACSTSGQAAGTIKPAPLVGKLVYLNEKHTEVGWQLEPATKNAMFAQVSCGGGIPRFAIGVKEVGKGGLDTLLARINGPYNKKTTELTPELDCTFGRQEVTSFWEGATKISGYLESETISELGDGYWENYCVLSHEHELHLGFEEEVELKA